jgi:hypothetical protein
MKDLLKSVIDFGCIGLGVITSIYLYRFAHPIERLFPLFILLWTGLGVTAWLLYAGTALIKRGQHEESA